MKKIYINKKVKACLAGGSLLGLGAIIAVSTSYAAPVASQNYKILFNGKIFDNYEQALRYYLSNNNVVNKELKYGDIGKAMVNLNTGELNSKRLISSKEGKKSIVYKTSFGRPERNYEKAQRTYVGPLFVKKRFTFAGDDKTFAKRENAQNALDASIFTDKVFYYKIKNNLFDAGVKGKTPIYDDLNKVFNRDKIVFNPFNADQIEQLKKYLLQTPIFDKMTNKFDGYWRGKNPIETSGFNIGIFSKNDKGHFKEFKFNKDAKNISDQFKGRKTKEKVTEVSVNFKTNVSDLGRWNHDESPFNFKFTNATDGIKWEFKDPGISKEWVFEEAQNNAIGARFNEGVDTLKIHYDFADNDDGKDGEIKINWSKVNDQKLFYQNGYNAKSKVLFGGKNLKETISAQSKKIKIERTYEINEIDTKWDHPTRKWNTTGDHAVTNMRFHYSMISNLKSKKDEKDGKDGKELSIYKKLFAISEFAKNNNKFKKVIKYKNQPIFEIVSEGGKYTLKNISNSPAFNTNPLKSDSKFTSTNNFNKVITFAQAFSYANYRNQKIFKKAKELNTLYMGKMENKNNNNNNGVKVDIEFYWGERLFYDKKQFNSKVYSDDVNAADVSFGGFWIQENTIQKSAAGLKQQVESNSPIVISVFVLFSIDNNPIIDAESVNDNSKYDDMEVLMRNSKIKIKPEIDKGHIFVFSETQKTWNIFSSEAHSVYTVNIFADKSFDTYKHAKTYLMEFIKRNSKKIY